MYEAMAKMFAYGQQNARMWVVGLEEHCGDDADLAKRIAIRAAQPDELFDLEAFHIELMERMPAINAVPVWRNTIAIYHGVYSQPTQLGRLNPETSDVLLAEILPFPRPQNNQWPQVYHADFPTLKEYLAFALPLMSDRLMQKIAKAERRPEVVILHGKGSHNQWLRKHPVMSGGWAQFRYGDRANETLKWRLYEGTLWLLTNNLVNNGHIRFAPADLTAIAELIRQHRVPRN